MTGETFAVRCQVRQIADRHDGRAYPGRLRATLETGSGDCHIVEIALDDPGDTIGQAWREATLTGFLPLQDLIAEGDCHLLDGSRRVIAVRRWQS